MSIFMGFGVGMVLAFILSIIIGGIFMWIAAKVARIEKSGFARAIVASIAASILTFVLAVVFGLLPIAGNFLGFVLGLLVAVLAIKAVFGASFGKALVAWIFYIVGVGVAILVVSILAASAVFMF